LAWPEAGPVDYLTCADLMYVFLDHFPEGVSTQRGTCDRVELHGDGDVKASGLKAEIKTSGACVKADNLWA